MKTIFKGNKFGVIWNIFHSTTNTPFDFTGLNVEVSLFSNNCSTILPSYKVSGNTIECEIESETLPVGVYDIMCRFSSLQEQAYCFYRHAFQISNNPMFAHLETTVNIQTYASHINKRTVYSQFNSLFLQYLGSPENTRNNIPLEIRRPGLIITYTNDAGETITERSRNDIQKENDHWGLNVNWSRIDELSLSGEISVSANGTWIINGEETNVQAKGPKGETGLTPWLKTKDNKLHFSYDNINWEECSDYIAHYFRVHENKLQISADKVNWEECSDYIAHYFRFSTEGSTAQGNLIGSIQISDDNRTWRDLSPKFENNLRIAAYVATSSDLPTGKAVGTIYGVGPTYAAEDTGKTNPIYRLYVYNGETWVDNGSFTSIAAGIVQETGDNENVVMSQKSVTEKLSELGSKVEGITSTKHLDLEATKQGYYRLDKPVEKGIPCKIRLKFKPWDVYTTILFYEQYGGGAYEEIKSAFYTADEVIELTPNIDANYIRIDCSTPSEGAVGKVVVYTERVLVDEKEFAEVQQSVNELMVGVENVESEISSLKYVKNINVSTNKNGYYKLDKPISKGEKCNIKVKFKPWDVYTNLVFYTQEGATSYEDVRTGFYELEEEFEYTPNIDVNYIRIDCSTPSENAVGEILIESEKRYVEDDDLNTIKSDIEPLKYKNEPIEFNGKSGYVDIGYTLHQGVQYELNYDITAYGGQFYYLELAFDNNGIQDILTTGGVGKSELKGTIVVIPNKDSNQIRIGVGSPVPESANTNIVIREMNTYVDKSDFDKAVNELEDKIKDNILSVESYFEEEMDDTISKINGLVNQRCLVMPIVADNHWRWTTQLGNNIKNRSINNIKYLASKIYCDGVVHMGDILDTGVLGDESEEELYRLMQDYLMQLSESNKNFYAINGNHDGKNLSQFNEMKWYGMIGRATANDNNVNRYDTTPYYYIDHKPTKLRCIFLANPDNVTGDSTYWGFSTRELEWLETEALKVPNGYNVLIFTHIPPISGYADSAANISQFISICNNFNNTNEGNILGAICGHCHVDLVAPQGWTYEGGFYNQLPFPIVLLGTNYWNLGTTDRIGEFGGTIYGRNAGTVTEDLWTVLVYTPDSETKFNFIRFGAGADVSF